MSKTVTTLGLPAPSARAAEIAAAVEKFVRETIALYERDPRIGAHGPSDAIMHEMRAKARAAGMLTPHILPDGSHLTQRETAYVLKRSSLSVLGPLAVNTAAPDEGNMFLLGKVATPGEIQIFLDLLLRCAVLCRRSLRAGDRWYRVNPRYMGGSSLAGNSRLPHL